MVLTSGAGAVSLAAQAAPPESASDSNDVPDVDSSPIQKQLFASDSAAPTHESAVVLTVLTTKLMLFGPVESVAPAAYVNDGSVAVIAVVVTPPKSSESVKMVFAATKAFRRDD